MENVAKTGAGTIVTTNPGCQLQMQLGVKRAELGTRSKEVEVVHLVELLDEAYRAAEK
jgi:glycolate oxidase iron-sulfur subunit